MVVPLRQLHAGQPELDALAAEVFLVLGVVEGAVAHEVVPPRITGSGCRSRRGVSRRSPGSC